MDVGGRGARRRPGRGAVAGAVLGVVLVGGAVWAGVDALGSDSPAAPAVLDPLDVVGPDGTATRDGDVATDLLAPGDCLRDAQTTGERSASRVVTCDQPHRADVYALIDAAPGTAGVPAARSDRACLERLRTLVPDRAERGTVAMFVVSAAPGASASPAPAEDPTPDPVLCVVQWPDDVTGSLDDRGYSLAR